MRTLQLRGTPPIQCFVSASQTAVFCSRFESWYPSSKPLSFRGKPGVHVSIEDATRPRSATLGAKNGPRGHLSADRVRSPRVSPGRRLWLRAGHAHLLGMDDPDLQIMTQQQVADLLLVPPRTLEEWRQNRVGPPWRRVGKHVRYLHEEVLAWFKDLDSHA
jgi:hypothetical protein